MGLICRILGHKWWHCLCSRCHTKRDQDHDWSVDCERCLICGATRSEAHSWSADCGMCSTCGAHRQGRHQWDGDKCAVCGMPSGTGQCDICGADAVLGEGYLYFSSTIGGAFTCQRCADGIEKHLIGVYGEKALAAHLGGPTEALSAIGISSIIRQHVLSPAAAKKKGRQLIRAALEGVWWRAVHSACVFWCPSRYSE